MSVLVFLALVLASCGSSAPSIDAAAAETVVVRYTDSSTPPQFHRSWSVTATDGSYDANVSSYGNPSATGTGSIDNATVTAFLDALGELGEAPDGGQDCTGGSSYYFGVLDAAGTTIYSAGSPSGCDDNARSWNTQAGTVARIVSSQVDFDPLYDQVDAAFDE